MTKLKLLVSSLALLSCAAMRLQAQKATPGSDPVAKTYPTPKPDDFIQIWGVGFRRDANQAAVREIIAKGGISTQASPLPGWEGLYYLSRSDKLIGEIRFCRGFVCSAVQYWDESTLPQVTEFAHKLISALTSASDHTDVVPSRASGITYTSLDSITIGTSRGPALTEEWVSFTVGLREIHLVESYGEVDGKAHHLVEIKEYAVTPAQFGVLFDQLRKNAKDDAPH